MAQTFSKFKNNFYQRIQDLSVLDCEEYNLLKVVLDGLTVDYSKRGITNDDIFKKGLTQCALRVARQLKHRRAIKSAKKKYIAIKSSLNTRILLFDNARETYDEHGKRVSFYFNKLIKDLGKENCACIYQRNTNLSNDVSIIDLQMATLFEKYSDEDAVFINNLKSTYKKIASLKIFDKTELLNIRVAANKFFNEYRLWRFILRHTKIEFAFFDQHYHREGMILAMKRKQILVLELQHGLIAPSDIFYVFPELVGSVSHKALFPDKIFAYGKYWADILIKGSEFKPSQIEILGLYQEINKFITEEDENILAKFLGNDNFILVTTQTNLSAYFINYVEWLSNDLVIHKSSIKIIVKLHPYENSEFYSKLKHLQNVKLVEINTEYLLSRCGWHVSCYSTTLYDALRHRCKNFSLSIDRCEDYVSDIVKQGISVRIENNQNPVFFDLRDSIKTTLNRYYFFENYEEHKSKLLSILSNRNSIVNALY